VQGRKHGFAVDVVAPFEVDGSPVSSGPIRDGLAAGRLDDAAALLGFPWFVSGAVIHGDKRGRELGFPTANVVPDERLVNPGHGVYACLANGLPAAVNVGVRPTFETGRGELVEAYLIDFDGDLYGSELRLHFLEKLRGERRFAGAGELIEAMHEDVARARAVCASASFGG
jgi:riboflavin kinase/FMN adenylyltransferase